MMRVNIDTSKTCSPGAPQLLFEGRSYADTRITVRGRTYDVSPDGQRFLMIKEMEQAERPRRRNR